MIDVRREFVQCGSIQSGFTKVEYLEWCEMVLREANSLAELVNLLVPDGTLKITGSTRRFAVVESWTFELATRELVRIHWHTPDSQAPPGSNSNRCDVIRIQVGSEFVSYDGANASLCVPPRAGGPDTAWNYSHIPIDPTERSYGC